MKFGELQNNDVFEQEGLLYVLRGSYVEGVSQVKDGYVVNTSRACTHITMWNHNEIVRFIEQFKRPTKT